MGPDHCRWNCWLAALFRRFFHRCRFPVSLRGIHICYAFSLRILGCSAGPEKTVVPASCITYLGIEIDAANQIVRLPEDKLKDATLKIAAWVSKRKCTKRELLSLIGKFSFAAKVVQPRRIFVRRLIVLSTSVDKLSHFIDINAEAPANLLWWHHFLRQWNGVQFFCIMRIPGYRRGLDWRGCCLWHTLVFAPPPTSVVGVYAYQQSGAVCGLRGGPYMGTSVAQQTHSDSLRKRVCGKGSQIWVMQGCCHDAPLARYFFSQRY